MNAWMRTGAGLWITALAIAGAAQPARSAEPVYLKCPGEVRSVQIDPVKGTKTEEAFRRIYILKVAESSFEVLERQGNDRVWADYCSRPGGGVDCTVTATAISTILPANRPLPENSLGRRPSHRTWRPKA